MTDSMPLHINKLITNIDQLMIWLRDNPITPIPSREKQRLNTIIEQLKRRSEISDEEWEIIKPRIIIDNARGYIRTKETPRKSTKNHKASEIKKKQENAFDGSGKALPKPTFLPGKKAQPEVQYKKGGTKVTCPGCNSRVLQKNIAKHKRKCKPLIKKERGNTGHKGIAQNGLIDNNNYKIERSLDGSSGYHNTRRENGKFGSPSSYDNMGDESGA